MFGRLTIAGALASVAFAAPAAAATLTNEGGRLVYTAAPGVANEVTLFGDPASPDHSIVLSSANDPIVYTEASPLPDRCQDADASPAAPPATTVACTGATVMTIDLGDMDDSGTTTGAPFSVTWLGGGGDDTITGATGDQIIDGESGDDIVRGGAGADVLIGGDGVDLVEGGPGADRLIETGTAEADVLRGDGGDDFFELQTDGVADVFEGGEGVDTVRYLGWGTAGLHVNLAIGRAGMWGEADAITGIEDVAQVVGLGTPEWSGVTAYAKITGDAGANSITAFTGDDTIDAGAGNDVVSAGAGDDVVELRDGFADRVSCGDGADTVQADTLDTVGGDCETVTRTDVGNANDKPDVPEDRPPTVSISGPAASSTLSTTSPTTITATAADDRGVAQVIFSTGERNLCVDASAPYTCDYRPTAADVGRDTLVVIAVDTAQQTASAERVVDVPRFSATGLSATTSPKRVQRAPYRFRTTGKLGLPADVPAASGCRGTVAVTFKAGRKTVSTRRVALKPDCSYSSRVTFRLPRRLNAKTLSVTTVFSGNAVLEGIRGSRHTVRPR